VLRLENVDVAYGDAQALWGLTLAVDRGETVALIGPNGAGKSTTLRTICGLTPPRRGTVEFEGEALHALEPHAIVERGVVHVPEGRAVFPELTVRDNLWLGGYCPRARAGRAEQLERVYELLPVLRQRARQWAGTLSGGEQQMLAIGRGLMAQPRLLMLDEPSLGLAPRIVDTIFDTIGQIVREGLTVLLVEQNVARALDLADRAYVLETGRLVFTGTAAELRGNDRLLRAYLPIGE
jgi:branched-chain amino acid transport system ATP-binding protein